MLTGESLAASGNSLRALEAYHEARTISEPIVAAHRRRIDYRRDLTRLYADMGSALVVLANPEETGIWYQKSLDLWKELQDEHALWAKEIDMPREVADNLSGLHLPQPS